MSVVLSKNPPFNGGFWDGWLFLFDSFFASVLGVAEGKDELKDEGKKNKTNLEASTFLEGVAELDGEIDVEEEGVNAGDDGHDVGEGGNSGKDTETNWDGEGVNPEVNADNFAEDVRVVDGDDGFPARFAGFGENLPPGDDVKNVDGEGKDTDGRQHAAKDATSSKRLILGQSYCLVHF